MSQAKTSLMPNSSLGEEWREQAITAVQNVLASQEFAQHNHPRGQAGLIVDALSAPRDLLWRLTDVEVEGQKSDERGRRLPPTREELSTDG
jgi:hypothetical protein